AFGGLLAIYFLSLLQVKLETWLKLSIGKVCDSSDASYALHGVFHSAEMLVGNLASMSALVAALAYGRGKDFDLRAALIWMAIFALVVLIWVIPFEMFGHTTTLFWTVIEGAPGILIANVALIALGWAFFARWGGTTWIYLALTTVYAILQFPANLSDDLE